MGACKAMYILIAICQFWLGAADVVPRFARRNILAPCTSGKAAFSIGGSGYKHDGEAATRLKLAEIAHRQVVEEHHEEVEHGLPDCQYNFVGVSEAVFV